MNTASSARAALSGTSLRWQKRPTAPTRSPPCCIRPRRRYPRELPQGSAVVEVHSAGVNPSDRRELQQGWIECQNLPKRCQITKWRANDISSLQKL